MTDEKFKSLGWSEQCPGKTYHVFTKKSWIAYIYFDGKVFISKRS